MERLPNELRQGIIENLALEDVKSIRLASKEWGHLGADYLIKPTFYTLPHRDDFTRLLQLSRHPVLESYVEKIVFNFAEMNDYQARHNIYFLNYSRDLDIRNSILENAWKDYTFMGVCNSNFAKDYCNPTIVREAFDNFTKIRSLEIRMKECPTENELLQKLWNIRTTQQIHRDIDSERLANLLVACSSLDLEAFTHDRLSLEFFRQDLQPLLDEFSGLSDLKHLSLDFTHDVSFAEDESRALMAKFSRCLDSMNALNSLHLSFKRRPQHPHLMSSYIFECTLPKLKSLHLSGIQAAQKDLISFMKRHSSSLRNFNFGMGDPPRSRLETLYVCGVEIAGCTGRTFFTLLSQNSKLDQLNLNGCFRFEEPDTGHMDGDTDWNLEADPGKKTCLERFVLKGGEWPKCWPEQVQVT